MSKRSTKDKQKAARRDRLRALAAHGLKRNFDESSISSNSSGKSEFDEEYFRYKPDCIEIDPENVVVIGKENNGERASPKREESNKEISNVEEKAENNTKTNKTPKHWEKRHAPRKRTPRKNNDGSNEKKKQKTVNSKVLSPIKGAGSSSASRSINDETGSMRNSAISNSVILTPFKELRNEQEKTRDYLNNRVHRPGSGSSEKHKQSAAIKKRETITSQQLKFPTNDISVNNLPTKKPKDSTSKQEYIHQWINDIPSNSNYLPSQNPMVTKVTPPSTKECEHRTGPPLRRRSYSKPESITSSSTSAQQKHHEYLGANSAHNKAFCISSPSSSKGSKNTTSMSKTNQNPKVNEENQNNFASHYYYQYLDEKTISKLVNQQVSNRLPTAISVHSIGRSLVENNPNPEAVTPRPTPVLIDVESNNEPINSRRELIENSVNSNNNNPLIEENDKCCKCIRFCCFI